MTKNNSISELSMLFECSNFKPIPSHMSIDRLLDMVAMPLFTVA